MKESVLLALLLSWTWCCGSAAASRTLATTAASAFQTSISIGKLSKHNSILLNPSISPSLLLKIRGGSLDSDSEDEDEDDSDISDDEDDDSDLDDLFGDDDDLMLEDDDDDFGEMTSWDRFLQQYQSTPPLTKAFLTASAALTTYGYLFDKQHQFPGLFQLDLGKVVKGQLWRPLTAFLNFGGLGLGYALTMQFVWTYMKDLERLHHHVPYDFWILIGFGMMSMLVGYPILGLKFHFLGHNLSTYLVYIWSRYHEGVEVNMFELFMTRAEVLPWIFLAQTFLLEGEIPYLDFAGICFGHIYYHLKKIGILRAPQSLVDWYKDSDSDFAKMMRLKYKQIASDFEVV